MTKTARKPATTSFRRVQQIIFERFPELDVREGWAAGCMPRTLLLDTIHLDEKPAYMQVKSQIETLVSGCPGVTVSWLGAQICVTVERARRS